MQPKIFSTSGKPPTVNEILVANLAIRAFSTKTGGSHLFVEKNSGARAIYIAHQRIVMTTPGTGYDYAKSTLPNPIPYRGVSIGVVDRGSPSATVTWVDTNGGAIRTTTTVVKNSNGSLIATLIGTVTQRIEGDGTITQVTVNFPLSGNPWKVWNGEWNALHGINTQVLSDISPSYESILAADQAANAGGVSICAVASNGETLARENQQYDDVGNQLYTAGAWSGGGYVDVLRSDTGAFHHKLTFNVPEDCVYPIPADCPYPQLAADWAAGQAAFRLRRKNWFKRASDAVLFSLAAGTFDLPRQLDTLLKGAAPTSDHTSRPILTAVTYADVVKSDTSANLTQAGEKVTERTATFSYSIEVGQPDGSTRTDDRQHTVVGTLKQTVTSHTKAGFATLLTHRYEYSDWYLEQSARDFGRAWRHQLVLDKHLFAQYSPNAGMGLLWNGVIDGHMPSGGTWFSDSTYAEELLFGSGASTTLLTNTPAYSLWYAGYSPALKPYSNTLSGIAPKFIRDYRKAVPIKYDKDAPGNTDWNDSALQDGQIVKLVLFGPAGKGVFGEWSNGTVAGDPADTAIDIFGVASYTYNEGIFTFKGWKPCKNADGTDLPLNADGVPTAKTVPLDNLPQPTTNAIMKYEGITWPDVIQAAKEHVKAIREGNVEAERDALLFKAILEAVV